jgi:hypothetical protein
LLFADIQHDVYKTLGVVSSFYSRGKLRIESRKELGAWFDRYKDLEMQQKYLNYFENVINALFEGINELDDTQYNRVKETAIRSFAATDRYFTENEKIPDDIKVEEVPEPDNQ